MIPKAIRHTKQRENVSYGTVIDIGHGHVILRDAVISGTVKARLPSHVDAGLIRIGDTVTYHEQAGEYYVIAHYGPVVTDGRVGTLTHQNRYDAPHVIDMTMPIQLGDGLQGVYHQGMLELSLRNPLYLDGYRLGGLSGLDFGSGVSLSSYGDEPGMLRFDAGILYSAGQSNETVWELHAGGKWKFTRAAGFAHGPEFTPDQLYWYTRGGVPIFRCGDARVEIGVQGSSRMLVADSEGGLRIHGSVITAETLDAEAIGPKLTAYLSRILGNNPIVISAPGETRSPWERGIADPADYVAMQFTNGLEVWIKAGGYGQLSQDARIFYVGPDGFFFGLPGQQVRMDLNGNVVIPANLLVGGRLRVNEQFEIGIGEGTSFSGIIMSSDYGFIGRSPGDTWTHSNPGGSYQVWWDRETGRLQAAMGDIVIGKRGLEIFIRPPRPGENPNDVSSRRTLRWIDEDLNTIGAITMTDSTWVITHRKQGTNRDLSTTILSEHGSLHFYSDPNNGFLAFYAANSFLVQVDHSLAFSIDNIVKFHRDVHFGNIGWRVTRDGKLIYSATNDVTYTRAALTIGTTEFDYGSMRQMEYIEFRSNNRIFLSIGIYNESPLFYSGRDIYNEIASFSPIRDIYSFLGRENLRWGGIHAYRNHSDYLDGRNQNTILQNRIIVGRHGVNFGIRYNTVDLDVPNLPLGTLLRVDSNDQTEYMRITTGATTVPIQHYGTVYRYGVERGYGNTSQVNGGSHILTFGRVGDITIEMYGSTGLFMQSGPGLAVYYRYGDELEQLLPAFYAGKLYFLSGRTDKNGIMIGNPMGSHMVWDRENGLVWRYQEQDRMILDANGNLVFVGTLATSSGSLSGWTLSTNALTGANITMNSTGFIQIGTGTSIVRLDSGDPYWRLWAGSTSPGNAPFRVRTDGYVYVGQIQINRAGFFNNAPVSAKPTVTGSRGGNAALASLLSALATYGLITDGTTA